MKCLVSIIGANSRDVVLKEEDGNTTEVSLQLEVDEPVVPAFCMGDSNHFIGVRKEGRSFLAVVREVEEEDPDEYVKLLHKQFLGFPKRYHEDTLAAVIKAAYRVNPDYTYRVFVTRTSAVLHAIEDESYLYTLWKDRDPQSYM